MANTLRPQGLRPKGKVLRANVYKSAGATYPGDCVTSNSSGQAAVATASQALLGVCLGYASAAGQDVLVSDHPDQEYFIQSNGAHPNAQSDLLLNYNIVAGTASVPYRVSGHVLDNTSSATTATLPLKLLSIDPRPDNTLGSNAQCVVIINNHQLKGSTGTAGV